MLDSLQRLVDRCMFRLARLTDLPKADVRGTLLNLAARGFQPKSLIDIGANRGKWSRIAKRVFPQCAITLIEPQQEMSSHLDAFCRRHSDCRWLCCGVSDGIGEQQFTVCNDKHCSSFQYSAEHAARQGWERRIVKTITLDSLVNDVLGGVPDVVKIDAEGNELTILSQAHALWGQTELFFVEANFCNENPGRNDFAEIVALMNARDYVPYDFTWFLKEPPHGVTTACELAFARRHGILRQTLTHKRQLRVAA